MRTVQLADFRPSRRADGSPWTRVKVDKTDDPSGDWSEVETVDLAPADEDPKEPALRSLTVTDVTAKWLRLVFLDAAGGEDEPCPAVSTAGAQFSPTIPLVSAILRERTYAVGDQGEEPIGGGMDLGGEEVGVFNDKTRPSAQELEETLIPEACIDVSKACGRIPGELLDEARRLAALRTASEIERSYIPSQADEGKTIFQTLRITFENDLAAFVNNLWAWTLANRGVA